MVKQIESLKKGRVLLLESISDLTVGQLNQIPQSLNNNIAWNMGHIIVVQQSACYKRADLPALISDDFQKKFKPGSQPKKAVSDAEIKGINRLFFTTINQLEADYSNQVFSNYIPWSTRLGGEVANIDDAIKFLVFHEGLHLDAIMAIARLMRK